MHDQLKIARLTRAQDDRETVARQFAVATTNDFLAWK
jgi:hypothetical protein